MTKPDDLLLIEEVATIARVSPETVRFWIKRRALPSLRPGRRRLVRREALESFLSRRPTSSTQRTEDGRRAVELIDLQELRLAALDAALQAIKEGWTLELQGPRPGISQLKCRGWIEPTVIGSEHEASVYADGDDPEHVLVELGLRWKERDT